MKNKTRVVKLIVLRERGASWECSIPGKEPSFFLAKSQVKPVGPGPHRFKEPMQLEMPEWLALKHKQICGDAAFEANKKDRT